MGVKEGPHGQSFTTGCIGQREVVAVQGKSKCPSGELEGPVGETVSRKAALCLWGWGQTFFCSGHPFVMQVPGTGSPSFWKNFPWPDKEKSRKNKKQQKKNPSLCCKKKDPRAGARSESHWGYFILSLKSMRMLQNM